MNTNNADTLKKATAAKPIHSISPFTLLDYPGHLASILWFAGCNMRCRYCYNPELVLGKGKLSYTSALNFLASRKNFLDAVVLSGGECTLHDDLSEFLAQVKEMGFLVKVDTNGSQPEKISSLLKQQLIDRVALDYKAPEKRFEDITGINTHALFLKTLDVLNLSPIPFEVRTTWHPDLLDIRDLKEMAQTLREREYQGKFFVQEFRSGVATLGNMEAPSGGVKLTELEENIPGAEFRPTN